MDKRDKGYTLYKKGLSCTEISKKLDVSINTVKSWRKRYWTQGADAPAKRTLHPEDAPAAPDPETRPKQGAPPGNVNAVGAGAPKGNRNAVKHGGWSELMFRSWTEEHRQMLDACDEDVDEVSYIDVDTSKVPYTFSVKLGDRTFASGTSWARPSR